MLIAEFFFISTSNTIVVCFNFTAMFFWQNSDQKNTNENEVQVTFFNNAPQFHFYESTFGNVKYKNWPIAINFSEPLGGKQD